MLTTTTSAASVSGATDTELFLETETIRQAVIIRQEGAMVHHDLDQDLGEMMTMKDSIPQAATMDAPHCGGAKRPRADIGDGNTRLTSHAASSWTSAATRWRGDPRRRVRRRLDGRLGC